MKDKYCCNSSAEVLIFDLPIQLSILGENTAAKIPITAITVIISIKVNALA